jgi:glycosidase
MPFIDNHDVDRAMFVADGDTNKYKIALTILLTSRGIPQIFYGTEIGINEGGHHGRIRKPFPGGFANDERDAFTLEGRTELENDLYNYTKNLLSLRKQYPALSSGKLTHYAPYDDTYVYFKTKDHQKIMVVINSNHKEFEVNLERMQAEFKSKEPIVDLINGGNASFNENGNLLLPAKTAKIYLLN